jgi:soluble lytic murein transglycosylase
MCRKRLAEGVAARKLHHYAAAEDGLGWVAKHCQDEDVARRAAYLQAKVISIRDGLRAIEAIEAFAKKYPTHSMTDDVLFWAGDLYQRRGRDAEARAYYERIDKLPEKGDFCGDARWRVAWMAYRRNDMPGAEAALARVLLNDGCAPDRYAQSRARFWLGRIAEARGDTARASELYRAILDSQALGFYAQQALPRLLKLQAPEAAEATSRRVMAPRGEGPISLCPDWLAGRPAFATGLTYLSLGLRSDAAAEFRSLEPASQTMVAASPASAQGVEERHPRLYTPESLKQCGPSQAALLLVLLLDRAGAYHDAHWRLRTEFGDELVHFPSPEDMVLWRAAYPLAYRELIAPAEEESRLPTYFLQALAREESAFDPHVVSWAEAYGLTQLMYSSGQTAGRFLKPTVTLPSPEALLDPALNARLGGALVGSGMRRFAGNLGLALASYNAGEDVASAWWKKLGGQEFAVFAEEMTIQETRGYVQRVLRTYGIYRWLYAGSLPVLPVGEALPPRPGA